MLISYFCDYIDVYIVVKGIVTVEGSNAIGRENRALVFKNNATFTSCISEIDSTLIDNAEDLDIVMPMYNLLHYSKNCRKTTGGLWSYYRDEPNDPIKNSESFKYKTGITEKIIEYNVPLTITGDDSNHVPDPDYNENKIDIKEVEIVVPLNHLSVFRRTLDMSLINCEVSLTDITARKANPNVNPPVVEIAAPTGATFKITDTKLYVLVVTLSAENYHKLLEQLKTGFT